MLIDLSNRNMYSIIYEVTKSGELRAMGWALICMQGEVVEWRRRTAIKIYDFININNLVKLSEGFYNNNK